MADKKRAWRQRKFIAQGGLCVWCKKPMSFNRKKTGQPARDFATFEHMKRRRDGGRKEEENVMLAHYKCNQRREGSKIRA